jgi:phenylacetic acid degradation operon negative regulatory protein
VSARASAQDLVFTLYGDYLMDREEPVWVGSLIVLLGQLGLSEEATRTALSRMTRRAWLTAERRGTLSYYVLTKRGRALLTKGRERIYHPPRHEKWDGEWSLITYSIPEARRRLRHQLRVRLLWLGCGMLGNGVWISPHDVRADLEEFAARLRLIDRIEIFRGRHLGADGVDRLVRRCWDLPAINAKYRAFVARWRADAARCRDCLTTHRGVVPCRAPGDCFVRRFRLVHEYREFPLIDPYLPPDLLPEDWSGDDAAALFDRYHTVLAEPAERHVDAMCAMTGPDDTTELPRTQLALARV